MKNDKNIFFKETTQTRHLNIANRNRSAKKCSFWKTQPCVANSALAALAPILNFPNIII